MYSNLIFLFLFVQSETSNHIPCDDIFGETPVGVRKMVSLVVFWGYFLFACSHFFRLVIACIAMQLSYYPI